MPKEHSDSFVALNVPRWSTVDQRKTLRRTDSLLQEFRTILAHSQKGVVAQALPEYAERLEQLQAQHLAAVDATLALVQLASQGVIVVPGDWLKQVEPS